MNVHEGNSSSQGPEEQSVPPEKSQRQSETSRYRFIMYCGLEKEEKEES